MKVLNLVLKRKWFEMIASGEKTEEYREIKPYWEKRLVDYNGIKRDFRELQLRMILMGRRVDACKEYPRGFQLVRFYCGYRKGRPSMLLECKGIEFGYGKPEWGAEPGQVYFVIKLGERLR